MLRSSVLLVLAATVAVGCATSGDTAQTAADTSWVPPADPHLVALRDDAATILDTFCSACHAGSQGAAGLDLTKAGMEARLIDVPSTQVDTLLLVDTTSPERSYLVMKMKASEGIVGQRMPLGGRLSDEAVADIEEWIDALAEARAGTPGADTRVDDSATEEK